VRVVTLRCSIESKHSIYKIEFNQVGKLGLESLQCLDICILIKVALPINDSSFDCPVVIVVLLSD